MCMVVNVCHIVALGIQCIVTGLGTSVFVCEFVNFYGLKDSQCIIQTDSVH